METHDSIDAMWPVDCEESAVLEALLCYLEASLQGQKPAPCATPGHAKKGTATDKKKQLLALRREIESLEDTLALLHSHHQPHAIVADWWKSVVSRQLTDRLNAEGENERLRGLVRAHEEAARQLQRLIADREENVKRTLGLRDYPRGRQPSYEQCIAHDAAILESVTNALLPMYLQTQWILEYPELKAASLVSDYCDGLFKKLPGAERPALHVLNSRVLPFDLTATSEAVWANLVTRLGSQPKPREQASNVLQTRLEELVQIPGFQGVIRLSIALQRFNEEDRVVFVRSTVFTYLNADGHNGYIALPGLTVRQSLWTIVRKVHARGLCASTASQIQTLAISVPAFVPNTEAHSRALDRFMMDGALLFSEFTNEDVDNRLLCGKGTSPYPNVAMALSSRVPTS